MFKKLVQLSALAATTNAQQIPEVDQEDAADHWAVLVAGSHSWMNYRHHADVCHAYQQAIANGYKEDQVIVILYDNVAQYPRNPFPGQLFNKPTKKGVKGVDVYDGCKIDYREHKASKETLLGVLKGDTSVGDKVLKSNEKSKVFFYFADHGAPGLVAMPYPPGKKGYLHAKELNDTINYMHENKMYDKMVMYIEACESGSMFKNLKEDIDVYTVTAANAKESSWGAYCHPDDKVDGKSIGTCLGDLFSVNWMEDLDKAMGSTQVGIETLSSQYDLVKKKTKKSHVLQFGDISWTSDVIGEFEAAKYEKPTSMWSSWKAIGSQVFKQEVGWDGADTAQKNDFAIDARDIKLHYLYSAVLEEASIENQKALMDEIDHRLSIDKRFEQIFPETIEKVKARDFPIPETDDDYECYMNLIDQYETACGFSDTYTMKYFGAFMHQCEAIKYYSVARDGFNAKLAEACPNTQ